MGVSYMEDFSSSSQVCTNVLTQLFPSERMAAWLLGAGATLPADREHNLVQLKPCHDSDVAKMWVP